MEFIKSLLFIVYAILLHVYSKDSASKLQRHVYNFFILVAIVWLITFSFFPYWKMVITFSFLVVNIYAVKTILTKIKTGKFVAPPAWIPLMTVAGICTAGIIIPSWESTLVTVAFGVFLFSILIVLEKVQQQNEIYENRKSTSELNDREKIVERIKKENIILEQKNSHSPNLYTFVHEINVADNSVLRNYIIEPLHPETSINRQAHSLAHELGHYYNSIERKRSFHSFILDCRKAKRLKPICGLFVLYDEWSAWNRAKQICLEEGVDISFFHFSRKTAFSTYVKAYWESIIRPFKTLIGTYIFSVAIVLFSVLLTDADIHLPFKLDALTNSIAITTDRTGAVNFIFFIIMQIRFLRWVFGLFFKKSVTDYQYAPEDGFVTTGNAKKIKD
ncbi:hypothetical protein P8818_16535 [Bacillus velezensis]|nr:MULTISPECIES: hypothetical protein [Bacillus]AYC54125.1 hypothetical protein C7M53_23045 [Bacillus licheniformis]MEC0383773.1 hypothetical protein [Bacillus velezensis]MEC0389160.1 hypothetical protein [Bacillus velezensis]NWN81280.1 hypothetical protein [Bacillus sp. (in: firmicutes)]WBY47953.1 hypothetical protein PF996_21650 [Bacillus velezensis]